MNLPLPSRDKVPYDIGVGHHLGDELVDRHVHRDHARSVDAMPSRRDSSSVETPDPSLSNLDRPPDASAT